MLSLLLGQAYAFCGHYVGGVGDELSNNASEVAIVRQGQRTTLTLANDYEGDATEFAVLIPVPEVLQQSDVHVVDQELVPRLASYSAPRLVRYTCDDFSGGDTAMDDQESDSGGSGGPNAEDGADGVVVENQFTVGAYEIVILSAQESSGLMSWLDSNGYAVSDNADSLLGEYIDGGAYFFAAKVSIDAVEGAAVLPPLQFGYDSEVFSLPVRLGTLNATGEQDLLIYVLGENGQTHISNYPETTLESDCMVDLTSYPDGLWSFYQESLKKAVGEHERPAWLIEYSWNPSGCDPCADEPPSAEEMTELGWSGATDDAHFTRLHMHYAPEQVDQDLVLYESGLNDWSQLRWIEYAYELEAYFPICGEGMADEPGDCNGGSTVDDREDDEDPAAQGDPQVDPESRRACGTPALPALGLALIALAALRRR